MAPQDPASNELAAMRQNYSDVGVDVGDLAADWTTQFRRWFADAVAAQLPEPNAMVLATASTEGVPSSRTVLAKAVDQHGVTFYTNYTSAKSHDLLENPLASATFPWIGLHRQVHVRGPVSRVDPATTAAYWETRPRGSQLGAWASPQSTVIADRHALDSMEERLEATYGGPDGVAPIPVPPHWGGWLIAPVTVEFWQGRTGRLHDRLRFRDSGDGWVVERLAP